MANNKTSIKPKTDKKMKIVLLSCMLAAICAVIGMVVYMMTQGDVVLKINGLPVYKEEFLSNMKLIENGVYTQLLNEQADKTAEFSWADESGGETGYQRLINQTINDLKEIKIVQGKAKENGLVKKIDYPSIKADAERENKTRQEKLKNDETVYGLQEYTTAQYYDYIYQNLKLDLKADMTKKQDFTVSDEEIKQLYAENADMFSEDRMNEVEVGMTNLGIANKFDAYIEEKVTNAKVKIMDRGELEKIVAEEVK